jgi:hypothetical protein
MLYVIDTFEKEAKKDGSLVMIDPAPRFGLDVNPSYIWRYRLRLKKAGVQQLTYGNVKEIKKNSLVADWKIFDRKTKGKQEFNDQTVPADTVILAQLVPNKDLGYGSFKGDTAMIGDCVWVRRGFDAIQDGFRLGMRF